MVEYQLARFPISARPLQKLGHADIETWHTALKTSGRHDGKGGVSARTIHHAHKLLTKALREGVRHGLLLRNVATEERPPKIEAEPMRILTPEQVRALPELLIERDIRTPAVVALFTGMRRGELLALSAGLISISIPKRSGSAPRSSRPSRMAPDSRARRPRAASA